MASRDLTRVLKDRYPGEQAAQAYIDQLAVLRKLRGPEPAPVHDAAGWFAQASPTQIALELHPGPCHPSPESYLNSIVSPD